MNKSYLSIIFYFTFLLFGISASTQASIISLAANIDGAQANAGAGTGSPGIGSASMTLDDATNEFNWNIEWSGLISEVTVAHFHGPALPGVNAGVQVEFDTSVTPSISNAVLTDDQAANLLAGLWYINIHSAAYPGGEIRGQVQVVPVPATIWFFSSGLLLMLGYSKRKKTA